MSKCIMLRNANDDTKEKLNKFWISLNAWMDQQDIIEKYFKIEYTEYNSGWNGGRFYLNIDYEQEYRIHYGETYSQLVIENRRININELKDFVEKFKETLKTKATRQSWARLVENGIGIMDRHIGNGVFFYCCKTEYYLICA